MKRKAHANIAMIAVLAVFVLLTALLAVIFVLGNDNSRRQEIVKNEIISDFSALEIVKVSKVELGVQSQEPDIKRVSFAAVGDNIVHSTVMSDSVTLAEGTDKEYNFVPMFDNVAHLIQEADFAYINQEAPIAGKSRGYAGYPMFNSPEQVVFDLSEVGFDIFNVANNHMLDRHTSGYKSTIEFFRDNGFTYIGGFMDKEDYENIRVIEKDGVKIALLSYTYGTNGLVLDQSSGMVVPLCDSYSNDEIDRQSKRAREIADIVIVSMHWGAEHWSDNFEPIALQKKQAEILINNNVDVILGSHPHALEPMMWKERPDGGRTLLIYSLGNFLSGMEYMRNHVGGIAGFDMVKVGDRTHVTNAYFIPTVCHFNNRVREFKIYKLSEYTEELLRQHGTQVRGTDSRRNIQYLYDIVDATIDDEFLIEDFYETVGVKQ